MNILAAILILGATGEVRREMTVEQQVAGIILRVGIGGVKDVLLQGEADFDAIRKRVAGILASETAPVVSLTIDNQPRTGWRAWGEVAWKTIGYISNRADSGSVDYSYRLHLRGYAIRRSTRIEDGHVLLTTTADWVEVVPVGRSTRSVQIHAKITIQATESAGVAGETRILGIAYGAADTRDFRCGIVRRLAERQAADALDRELADALRTIQQRGTGWYRGADAYTGILDRIGDGVREIGPRIGRR